MELSSYVKTLWRWAWLIGLGVAVALGSTYLAVREQPPTYQAGATLVVGQILQQQQPTYTDIYTAQDLAQTYATIAARRTIREATMEALGLTWLPEYSATPVANTQLLEIRVVDTDPQRAAAVANELAKQLILQSPGGRGAEEQVRQAFVKSQLDDLEASIEATKAEIARQQELLAGMFSAREIADTQSQIAALQQKLSADQSNYGQLLAFLGEGSVNSLSIVEPAVVPAAPSGPGKVRTLLMAAAVGLVLAVATAFLLEYLDDTVKTPEDIEKAMHLTMLAGISRIPGEKAEERLITVKHPKSPISEAYRVLRTNLQFSSLDRPLRTLVVTSANPTEGKSTTVANLGAVMAQAGKRVIIIDSDLRRPVQHRIFGVENREGLTEALLLPDFRDGHLKQTGVENLRLLNTGALPPNPSELLGSQRMGQLIERLKEEADVILFDSPPAMAVTDASVLGTLADGVLIVVDAGRTRRNAAKETAERLRQVGANVLGAALNRLKPGRSGYYYYYYYYSQDGTKRRRKKGLRGLLKR
jgi:non-specific protein-tyrosine kinase